MSKNIDKGKMKAAKTTFLLIIKSQKGIFSKVEQSTVSVAALCVYKCACVCINVIDFVSVPTRTEVTGLAVMSSTPHDSAVSQKVSTGLQVRRLCAARLLYVFWCCVRSGMHVIFF